MSFDVFENIFTASDPAGGRAIKVSALTGIDSAESIYTQSDPAGGRAIKVKIIGGGASNGTLQVAGGVPLDGTTRNITDSSSPTAVASPLFLSTESVTIKPNPLSLPTPLSGLVLLTLDSSALDTVNSTLRINARTGLTAFIRFSHSNGSSFTNIGDFRADSTNGLAFNANTNFPINFYVNDTAINAARISSIGEFSTAYGFSFYDINLNSANRKLLFTIAPSTTITGTAVINMAADQLNFYNKNLAAEDKNLILQITNSGLGGVGTVDVKGSIIASGKVSFFAAADVFAFNVLGGRAPGVDIKNSANATSDNLVQNSPFLQLRASGYNGTANVYGGFKMYTRAFANGVDAPSFQLQFENFSDALLLRLNNSTLGLGVTNLAVDSGAGLTIATATSQKLGFWNVTPVVQPTTAVTAATFNHVGTGQLVHESSTFGGYTIGKVVGALRLIGILA